MAIDTTYRKLIIDNYIKEQLTSGIAITAADVVSEINTLLNTLDLTVPQFTATDFHIETLTSSSATQFNNTFSTIRQDMTALYKEMINLTKVSLTASERWNIESAVLEKKLIDLEERIDNLLILIQDVSPQQGVIIENFTDMNLVDKSLSTVDVDVETTLSQLGHTGNTVSRIFLNDLEPGIDVRFKVRSSIDFIARNDSFNSTIADPFSQEFKSWWTSVSMKTIKPVACEYVVKIDPDAPILLSKIFIDLHDSTEASPTVITPLYSTDNVNYFQLPSITFTQEVRDTAVFTFPTVQAQWVKFILIKQGPDLSSSNNNYSYQFGFKQITFYSETFDVDTIQVLVSKPLYVRDSNGNPREFEKLTLETCECIETNTKIKYYITVSNDSDVPVDSNTVWSPITPVNREQYIHPRILTVGDIEDSDIENIGISINADSTGNFNLISDDGSGNTQTTSETATVVRYKYKNSNDRILDYQIKDTAYTGSGGDPITINPKTLQLFRNVGEQSLNPSTDAHKVREVQRGWRFEDPYYTCTILIENPAGISMDVGNYTIIIDNVEYNGEIDKAILTGKSGDNTGVHSIKVHKSRWKYVDTDIGATPSEYLTNLKKNDVLYPYNHKLLIEGFSYPSDYPETDEKVYKGADLFAEKLMRQVSPFDIYSNIRSDNYNAYAFDRDALGSHSNSKPTTVLLLKVSEDDEENDAELQKEKFTMKFTRINQLQKYLRVKADLSTSDTTTTPALHSYKIKLG